MLGTFCSDCSIGHYQDQNTQISASCQTCGAGRASPASTLPCLDCSTGKFQELTHMQFTSESESESLGDLYVFDGIIASVW